MRVKIALSLFLVLVTAGLPARGENRDGKSGFQAGDFLITPTLSISQAYDDNIYTEDSGAVGDFLTRVSPRVKIETQNRPYDLTINGTLEQVWFADETQNHYLNARASAKYRYRLDADTVWDAYGSFALLHEMPGDDDADPGGDAGEPLPVQALRAGMSMRRKFDAFNMGFNLTPRMGASIRNYVNVRRVDGTMIDQGGRDRSEYMAGGRLGAKPSKTLELFADGAFTPRSYSRESATSRDSGGGSFLAGFKYRPDAAFSADIAAGYMYRDYDSPSYDDIAAPAARAAIRWRYAPDSRLSLRYARSIAETTQSGAGGRIVDDLRLKLTHSLSDTLNARAEGRFRHAAFRGGNGADDGASDRRDRYYGLSLGLAYDVSARATLGADYTLGRNTSNDSAAEYTQNVFLLSLKAGL